MTTATPITGTALCWGSVPQADLLQLGILAARHGFPEISVRPWQYHDADRETPRRLNDLGVKVGVIDALITGLPGSPSPEELPANWRGQLNDLQACMAAAQALGARTLNVAHYLGDPSVAPSRMAEAIGKVAARCAQSGVRVSMEFIPETGIPDLATALEIVRQVDRPDVGVLFDTWHFLRAGGEPHALAALEPEVIIEAQISDRVPPLPGEPYVPMAGRLAPGDGEAPLTDLIRHLRAASPEIVLAVEVFTAEVPDPDDTVAHLAATTRMLLGRLEDLGRGT